MSLFTPSTYQQDFFDALRDEDGDLQLVAVAGSGKSTSIEEGVKRLSPSTWRSTLCTAFNNHIKTALADRQKAGRIPPGVNIQTIHGLGYGILRNKFNPRDTRNWVDGKKYTKITRLAWEGCREADRLRSHKDYDNAVNATAEVVRLAMLTLTEIDDPEALSSMADHYSVELPPEEFLPFVYGLTPQIIWGGQNGLEFPDRDGLTYHPAERISFDDMVYLPVALGLPVPQYSLSLVDECQDFNRCQQELLYKARGNWGRAVWVGDPRQSIYAFTGADPAAFDRIQEVTGATRLPLSICYRCAKSVVQVAKRLVPTIEASDTAPEGVVVPVTEERLLALAAQHYKERPGEAMLILCRTNAPLIGSAFSLIRRGVRATVKGRDIGQSLARTLEEIARMQVGGGFASRLEVYRGIKAATLERQASSEMAVANLHDRLDSLAAVFDGLCVLRGYTVSEADLQAYVLSLFSDEQEGGVVFSSIHKAKGLEARRVGILHAELLPHPKANSPMEAQQERNLAYVAVTRAREELYIAGSSCLIGSL